MIIECHTVLLLACNLACNYIESVTYLMMHVNNAFRKRAQPLSFRICFNKNDQVFPRSKFGIEVTILIAKNLK